MTPLGVLSMLHEGATDNSATRTYRDHPVLWWTLTRLAAVQGVDRWHVLCFDDQLPSLKPLSTLAPLSLHPIGPRQPLPQLDSLTTATHWLDAYRGGLLQTADFDQGFHAPSLLQLATSNTQQATDSVLLVSPASALIDPALVTSLLDHASKHEEEPLVFSQAAPGLSATLLRLPLLKQLAQSNAHPGQLLAYQFDRPGKDPIALPGCAPVPTRVARTTRRFKLDSKRQIDRLSRQFHSLNGQLISTGAEQLVQLAESDPTPDPLPREVTIELTTHRNSNPIFSPLHYTKVDRRSANASELACLFAELSEYPDTRLTFAGVGDPLLHPSFPEIITAAHNAGLTSLHLETDLLGISPDTINTLASLPLDIISIHLPATTEATYATIMGKPAFLEALENLKSLVIARHARSRGVPLIVPTFVKCRANLHEMEPWYDQWLRALGSAVITAPTPQNDVVPAESVGIPQMTPPNRRPCHRLHSRMTILSDGTVARCEEDAVTPTPLGTFPQMSIKQLWAAANELRAAHAQSRFTGPCASCTQWHRP